jgi:hypothetical protein
VELGEDWYIDGVELVKGIGAPGFARPDQDVTWGWCLVLVDGGDCVAVVVVLELHAGEVPR